MKIDKAHGDAKVASQQLEAFFLRQLLAETKPQSGSIDGGFAGDTFKQMLNEAIADKMVAAGGIGMSTVFAKQLGQGDQAVMATPHVPGVRETELGPAIGDAPRLVLPVAAGPRAVVLRGRFVPEAPAPRHADLCRECAANPVARPA